MPKFLYTIIISSVVLWILVISRFNVYPPDTQNPVQTLITLLFILIALSITLSIPVYYYFYKKAPTFSNLKGLYRKSLRLALLISIFITGFELLKGFGFLNIFTAVIYFTLCYVVAKQLHRKRKKL